MGETQGEFRLVTALFADLSGFTPLTGRLDPEELLDVIDPIVSRLSSVVARYDGYVEKFAGDALLAVFGAPVAHEDDASRALLTALDMQRELDSLRVSLPASADGLELHIGINSGRGVARVIGSDARVDYGVLGDVVVLAQRLEASAPAGTVYVSESTHRLTESAFEFASLGELELKGVDRPVGAWRLVGHRPEGHTRRQALIGRSRELCELLPALDAIVEGRGSLVSVTGEPGVGKSRLSAELRRQAEGRGARWLQARCLSYGAALPYWPYADLLRRIDPEAGAASPFLGHLLGRRAPDLEQLDPAAFRRGVEDAFGAWIHAHASDEPLVLGLEDVHWADEASLELTAWLVRLSAKRPLLLCLTAREEGEPAIRTIAAALAAAPHIALELQPLAADAVEDLTGDLLGAPPPPELVSLLIERTQGNPFFTGELVRSLLETGALERDDGRWRLQAGVDANSVPATLESVLSGRIDLLEPDDALLLQKASVIGRTVPIPLLRAVTGVDPAARLDELVRRRFLDSLDSETVSFHHALVQDVAYSRLLRRHRRSLHEQIAVEAERLYGGGDAFVDLLARHFYLGGAGRKAVEYLQRSGDRARRVYANDKAASAFEQALDRLADVPDEEADQAWRSATASTLQESLGSVFLLAARYQDAAASYRAALDLEVAPLRRSRLLVSLGESVGGVGRYGAEGDAYAEAERELGSAPAVDEDWWRAWLDVRNGQIGLAYWLNDQGAMKSLIDETHPVVERCATAEQRVSFFHSVALLGLRRERYCPADETVRAAWAAFEAGIEIGEEHHFSLGFCLLWHGDLDEAESHLRQARALAERTGDALLRLRSIVYGAVLQRKREDALRVGELLELLEGDELLEYAGLVAANRAWLAWRQRDVAETERLGKLALDEWSRDERAGPTVFQWTARWPLVGAALSRADFAVAAAVARFMLDPSQQPLPDALAEALASALDREDEAMLAQALELARTGGYA
jgi:class 3 adenylate cyclase